MTEMPSAHEAHRYRFYRDQAIFVSEFWERGEILTGQYVAAQGDSVWVRDELGVIRRQRLHCHPTRAEAVTYARACRDRAVATMVERDKEKAEELMSLSFGKDDLE